VLTATDTLADHSNKLEAKGVVVYTNYEVVRYRISIDNADEFPFSDMKVFDIDVPDLSLQAPNQTPNPFPMFSRCW
jgi:hypothetical protein